MTQYVVLNEDCVGTECNNLNIPISYFMLRQHEVFKIHGTYNYYEKPDADLWNTEHPVVELSFTDMPGFHIYYEIPPNVYTVIDIEDDEYPLDIPVTQFREVDLVEREESMEDNIAEQEKVADKILDSYMYLSEHINRNRQPKYKWPLAYNLEE